MKLSKPTKLKLSIVLYLMSMTLLSFGQTVETVLPNRIGSGTHSALINTESALHGIALRGYDMPDVFRYKNVTKVQYYDGVTWVDWVTEDWKNLLDGNDNNVWSIPAPYGHFRITIDLGGTWVRPSAILIGQDWDGGDLNYTLTSESSNDQSNWSTELSQEPTNGSTAQNIFMLNSQTGVDRYIRLTFNSGATSTNKFRLYQLSGFTKRLVGVARATYTNWDKNVGIGTANPDSKLHVSSSTSGDAVLKIDADTDNNNESDNARIELMQDGGALGAYIGFSSDWGGTWQPDNLFRIGVRYSNADNFNALVVRTDNGNVGIGTTAPDAKLAVNGTIHTKEVKVDLVGWADYVFDKDYELKSLEETASYIKEEGHLPNIPSAEEVAENGIQLGEMNAKLLEKIEELTLHLIELKKENKDFQKRIEALETK